MIQLEFYRRSSRWQGNMTPSVRPFVMLLEKRSKSCSLDSVTVGVKIRFGAAEVIFHPPNGNAIFILYTHYWYMMSHEISDRNLGRVPPFFNWTFHVYRKLLKWVDNFLMVIKFGGFKLVFDPEPRFPPTMVMLDFWRIFGPNSPGVRPISPEKWALFVVVWLLGEGAREKNPMLGLPGKCFVSIFISGKVTIPNSIWKPSMIHEGWTFQDH